MLVFVATMIGIGAFGALPAGETSAQILQRSRHLYESCRTYEGTLVQRIREDGQQRTETVKVAAEVGTDRQILRGATRFSSSLDPRGITWSVSDGTFVYEVNSARREYSRRSQVKESVFALFSVVERIVTSPGAVFIVSGPPGDEVYTITARNSVATARAKVSKSTGEIFRIDSKVITPDHVRTLTLTVEGQRFNQPIPPERFHWAVPDGYHEVPQVKRSYGKRK